MGYICTKMGFSYEEIPIFIIPKYARNTFLQAHYTITHHCNKPIFPIMFLFTREKLKRSKNGRHTQCLRIKTDCTVFLFCTVRLNYIQCKEMTLILRQQTSGPMPEDG